MRKIASMMMSVMLLLAMACGSGQQNAGTEQATPTADESSTSIEKIDKGKENKPLERIKVVYIQKNTGNPYFDAILEGYKKAAYDFGFRFETTGPETPEATSQIRFIKDQVQRGVDVLGISPNSPDALNPVLDRARERGVLVMTVNSDMPGSESHRDLAILPTDFDLIGAQQVELLGSMIDYKGQFAILSSTTDAPDQNYWIEGMKEALKDPKYAGMELVDIVYGDDLPQKSQTEAEGLLTKFPELRGIIAPTTVGIAACAQTVQLAGVYPGGENAPAGGGVVVTGLGSPNLMRGFVEQGVVEAFALWSPFDEGYLAGYLSWAIKTGELTPGEGVEFEVPNLGTRSFGKDNAVITGPPFIFNAENINDFHF